MNGGSGVRGVRLGGDPSAQARLWERGRWGGAGAQALDAAGVLPRLELVCCEWNVSRVRRGERWSTGRVARQTIAYGRKKNYAGGFTATDPTESSGG